MQSVRASGAMQNLEKELHAFFLLQLTEDAEDALSGLNVRCAPSLSRFAIVRQQTPRSGVDAVRNPLRPDAGDERSDARGVIACHSANRRGRLDGLPENVGSLRRKDCRVEVVSSNQRHQRALE